MSSDGRLTRTVRGAADLPFVDELLGTLDGLFAQAPAVPERDRTLFSLALSEVATNIAQHSTRPVTMSAHLEVGADRLSAEIRDDADPVRIDWAAVRLPGEQAESGRGLALAVAVLDELSHRADPAGNTWVLVRHADGASTAD
ncbi:ATP-binding protein [Microbacterium sp. 22242]|uniref:ATP-binding protein n=1 Tax=Microbacterium sp. 22242 TaxID=3453896 RepID=UPI003F8638D9